MLDLIENRQIRIFISSTFRDMMDERDYLVTKVFPSLRKYCEERDITLFELDLRWGITEDESKQGKVVETCLHEIQNTKPFFIGLLGDRYGWVPNENEQELINKNTNVLSDYPWVRDELNKGTSITEIEIHEGVLRAKEKVNAYFYFRSSEVEVPPDYMEKKGSQAEQKLVELKSKIRELYPIMEFTSKEELGQLVEKDFKDLVNNLFPNRWISVLEKERLEQTSCLKRLTHVYIPRNIQEEALNNFINSNEKSLVITGDCGMGKSALLANWIQKKGKEVSGLKILYHFVGISQSKGNFRKIRQRLINEVRKIFGIVQNLDEKLESESAFDKELTIDEKKKDELQKNLFSIPQDENLIIILDGINKLTDIDDAKQLDWLPEYPENVKFIFSTIEDDPVMYVFKRKNYPVIVIPSLDIESRKCLIINYLQQFGKKLIPTQIDRIANDKESANPMVLCTLLDELRIFGVFEKLDEEIDRYLSSPSIPDFYEKVLERLEKIFDYRDTEASNLAMDILSLLYVSRNGLSEVEIIALTGAKPVYWSQVYNALGNNIIAYEGLLNFSHIYLREAVERRYFSDRDKKNSYRIWLVQYLKTNRDVPEKRIEHELPYQLYHLEDSGGLYRYLKKQGLLYLIKKDINELAKYCRSLNENDKKKISNDIEKELEQEFKNADKNELAENYFIIGAIINTLGIDNSLALKFTQQAMAIREEIHGKVHENTAESYFYMGMLQSEKGNYQNALEFYQQALNIQEKTLGKNHEDTARTNNNIGMIYYSMGDYTKAIIHIEQALNIQKELLGEKHIDTAASYNNIGLIYNSMGDKQKFIEFTQRALILQEEILGRKHKNTALCYNNIGMGYTQIGDYANALKYAEQALNVQKDLLGEKHVDTATSYNNIGEIYALTGNYQSALEHYQQAFNIQVDILGEKHPQTILMRDNLLGIRMILGVNYFNKNDCDSAINELMQAIKLAPTNSGIYVIRAAINYQIDDNNATMTDIKTAFDLGCKDALEQVAKLFGEKGNSYLKSSNNDLAIIEYSKAIKINPNYTTAYNSRGNAYYSKKEYDNAIADYSQAIVLNPNEAVYYSNRGGSYNLIGDYEKAMKDYTESIRINPNNADTYNRRANIFYSNKDYDKAIDDYTLSIRINPNNAVYFSNRGDAYYLKKEVNKAIIDYTQAITINPNYTTAYNRRGNTYHSNKEYEKAIADYSQAIYLNPNEAVYYSNRGGSYKCNGDYEKAIADYETVLKINPNNANAKNAIDTTRKELLQKINTRKLSDASIICQKCGVNCNLIIENLNIFCSNCGANYGVPSQVKGMLSPYRAGEYGLIISSILTLGSEVIQYESNPALLHGVYEEYTNTAPLFSADLCEIVTTVKYSELCTILKSLSLPDNPPEEKNSKLMNWGFMDRDNIIKYRHVFIYYHE